MTNRITFNIENMDTIRALDNYCNSQNISRSKAISALLESTVPVLNDISFYHQLGSELNRRLLSGIYYQDFPRRGKTITFDAVKYCQSIFNKDLLMYTHYLLESMKYVKEDPSGCLIRDGVNDNEIGMFEIDHLENISKKIITRIKHQEGKYSNQTRDYYACYVSLKRDIKFHEKKLEDGTPQIKRVINDGVFFYLKNVISDGLFFDFTKIIFIKIIDLFSVGINGVAEASKEHAVYCWVPIQYYGDCAIIVPVYKLEQLASSISDKNNKLIIVHSKIKITHPDYSDNV